MWNSDHNMSVNHLDSFRQFSQYTPAPKCAYLSHACRIVFLVWVRSQLNMRNKIPGQI